MTTKTERLRALCDGATPVAWIVDASAVDLNGEPVNLHDVDYYQEDIESLPVGTKLYAAINPTEVRAMMDLMGKMAEALEFASDFIPASCCESGECQVCKAAYAFDQWNKGYDALLP